MLKAIENTEAAPSAPAEPRKKYVSHVRIQVRTPCIMLVRLEPGEEPKELALDDLFVRVLRVRHPLPAVQRMRITRPLVVVLGESVREEDRRLLVEQAHEIGAAILPLGPLVSRRMIGSWLRNAMQLVIERRAERGECDCDIDPDSGRLRAATGT